MLRNILREAVADGCSDFAAESGHAPSVDVLRANIEMRLVRAAWTLRRMPDREKGWLLGGNAWPEIRKERPTDYKEDVSVFEVRLKGRLTKVEVDDMEPTLDMLLLLPDVQDRQLLFWASWAQEGELLPRIPWKRVKEMMKDSRYAGLSRTTLWRYHQRALDWLAAVAAMKQEKVK